MGTVKRSVILTGNITPEVILLIIQTLKKNSGRIGKKKRNTELGEVIKI